MTRTIQCFQCGVVLNLPETAVGRKLKCPRCGTKFRLGESGPIPIETGAGSSPSSGAIPTSKSPNGLSSVRVPGPGVNADLPMMPHAPGDLRETFDLPLMTGSDGPAAPAVPAGPRQAADALALFQERPAAPKRKTGAEARAHARRCPTCGGVVPQGMSICQTCGLDLETGMRVGLEDDLAPPPASRVESLPLAIGVLGSLCGAGSAVLIVVAILNWQNGGPFLTVVSLFGVYASVQFLRRKSVKMLMAALTVAALVNVVGLIGIPVYNAYAETQVFERQDLGDDPNAEVEYIRPVSEQLDTQRVTLGITFLFLYAVVSIYLLSPTVQRHYRK